MPTILIADDDHTLSVLLRQTLASEGYRVLIATNGKEALAQAQAHRPDLVMLDWIRWPCSHGGRPRPERAA